MRLLSKNFTTISLANHQDFLKMIAILAMFIDHIGLFFYPELEFMRAIGRIVMPIFAFYAGYNFKIKINHSLLIFGGLLAFVNFLVLQRAWPLNILFTIYIGQLYLFVFSRYLNNFWLNYLQVVFLLCFALWSNNFFEYGTLVISIMIMGYISREHRELSPMLLFATYSLSLFFYFLIFNPNTHNLLLCFVLMVTIYVIHISRDANAPIFFDIRAITRNSVIIYSIHLIIIEIIFFCIANKLL